MTKISINEEICKGCKLCTTVCPKKIIIINDEKINLKGFHPVGISELDKCIGCGFCATICPDSVIEIES